MIDYTQWVVITDLTNKVLYFRFYQDLTLKRVDMKKLDFNLGAETKTIRIETRIRTILDMTEKLRGSSGARSRSHSVGQMEAIDNVEALHLN
jgi:penicillin V acylase-like amidase (Ntn superfamily)